MSDGGWPLLAGLGDDDRRRIVALARRRRFDRGEVLFHQGDPGDTLHVVDKGHVALRSSTGLGASATLSVVGPGEMFGEQALVGRDWKRTATAVAVEPTETRVLHRDDFDEARAAHPSIDRFLVDLLAERLRLTSEALLEAYFVPAEQRVLRRLAQLAPAFVAADGRHVVPLTQEDLAAAAGTTRPTANRALRAAEDGGVVRMGRGRVEVLDLRRLRQLAR